MCSERFHAEYFRRVMSAQEEVHADFFRRNRGPVRRFACDEGVDSFGCDPINFRARGSRHNAYRARAFRTETENLYRTTEGLFQFTNEFAALERCASFDADRLTLFFQE